MQSVMILPGFKLLPLSHWRKLQLILLETTDHKCTNLQKYIQFCRKEVLKHIGEKPLLGELRPFWYPSLSSLRLD